MLYSPEQVNILLYQGLLMNTSVSYTASYDSFAHPYKTRSADTGLTKSYKQCYLLRRGQRLFTARDLPGYAKAQIIAAGSFKLSLVNSSHAPAPVRLEIANPATHLPEYFVEVQRLEDNRPQLLVPKSWHTLKYVIYLFVDEDGKPYVGRSATGHEGTLPARLSHHLADFEGCGNGRDRSLPRAWRSGKKVYVGVWHVCSSKQSAKQWETVAIVNLKSHIIGHNKGIGNGIATLHNGSPIKGSPEARVINLYAEDAPSRNWVRVVDPGNHEPIPYAKVEWNEDMQRFCWNYLGDKEAYSQEKNVIYQFTDAKGKVYIGRTEEELEKRMSGWLTIFNNPNVKNSALSRAVQRGVEFTVGLLYFCSHQSTLEDWESIFIFEKQGYYNRNYGNGNPYAPTGSPRYKTPKREQPSTEASKVKPETSKIKPVVRALLFQA